MQITPDAVVFWELGPLTVNATLVFTWVNMVLLVVLSAIVARPLALSSAASRTRTRNLMEAFVETVLAQLSEMGLSPARDFLPLLGTLFLFILVSNVLGVIPGYHSPTGSLSTTAALALCVFVAVPVWGVRRRGLLGYLRLFVQPSPFMLPFNIVGDVSRTLALAVRLFGNVMSGSMIAAILVGVAPLLFPVIMQLFGLVTGVIQAYIFTVLAAVYISAAVRVSGTSRSSH